MNGVEYNSANGGILVFYGVNDYVSFVSNQVLTNQVTFETWVDLSSTTPNEIGTIFSSETEGNGSYRMLYSSGSFSCICATANNGWYTTGTAISAGSLSSHTQTYQLVGTYNGSNNSIYGNEELNPTGANISGNILTTGIFYLMRK